MRFLGDGTSLRVTFPPTLGSAHGNSQPPTGQESPVAKEPGEGGMSTARQHSVVPCSWLEILCQEQNVLPAVVLASQRHQVKAVHRKGQPFDSALVKRQPGK